MGYTSTKRQILKISYITVLINIVLVTAKLIGGFYGHSQALLTEAIHSSADLVSTLIVVLSVYLMHLSTNEKERRRNNILQGVFSLVLTAILLATCINLVCENVVHIVHKSYLTAHEPESFELIIAGVALVSKEIIYHWTLSNAKRLHFPPLEANAWHQRLEAMISLGTFISILLVKFFDFKLADNVISIVIALFLLFIIYEDLVRAIEKISGKHFHHNKNTKHDGDIEEEFDPFIDDNLVAEN
jgi:cation diffusion facilitator family transporter